MGWDRTGQERKQDDSHIVRISNVCKTFVGIVCVCVSVGECVCY